MYKDRPEMKGIYITKYGGSDQVLYGSLRRPEPKSGQVLVRVRAAAVNPRDWIVRASLATGAFRLVTLGRKPSAHLVLARANGDDLEQIAALMAQGRVKSLIDSRYLLSEARAALERSRSWRSRGKIVLAVA